MLSLGKNIGYQWVERQNGWGKNDWKKEHVGVVGLFSPLHVRNRTTDSKISCSLLPARLYHPIPCLPTWKKTDPEWELALNFIPCICYPSYICTLFSLSLICNGSTWIPCIYVHCTARLLCVQTLGCVRTPNTTLHLREEEALHAFAIVDEDTVQLFNITTWLFIYIRYGTLAGDGEGSC